MVVRGVFVSLLLPFSHWPRGGAKKQKTELKNEALLKHAKKSVWAHFELGLGSKHFESTSEALLKSAESSV